MFPIYNLEEKEQRLEYKAYVNSFDPDKLEELNRHIKNNDNK